VRRAPLQSSKHGYRCVIDGLWYDTVEAAALHLRMQHGIENYGLYVVPQKPW
jgi:hypothetical protein